jgi:hypothetical protein
MQVDDDHNVTKLPTEILIDSLFYLSPEEIIHKSSVCKQWYSLIHYESNYHWKELLNRTIPQDYYSKKQQVLRESIVKDLLQLYFQWKRESIVYLGEYFIEFNGGKYGGEFLNYLKLRIPTMNFDNGIYVSWRCNVCDVSQSSITCIIDISYDLRIVLSVNLPSDKQVCKSDYLVSSDSKYIFPTLIQVDGICFIEPNAQFYDVVPFCYIQAHQIRRVEDIERTMKYDLSKTKYDWESEDTFQKRLHKNNILWNNVHWNGLKSIQPDIQKPYVSTLQNLKGTIVCLEGCILQNHYQSMVIGDGVGFPFIYFTKKLISTEMLPSTWYPVSRVPFKKNDYVRVYGRYDTENYIHCSHLELLQANSGTRELVEDSVIVLAASGIMYCAYRFVLKPKLTALGRFFQECYDSTFNWKSFKFFEPSTALAQVTPILGRIFKESNRESLIRSIPGFERSRFPYLSFTLYYMRLLFWHNIKIVSKVAFNYTLVVYAFAIFGSAGVRGAAGLYNLVRNIQVTIRQKLFWKNSPALQRNRQEEEDK